MGEDFGVKETLKRTPTADPTLSSRIFTPEEYSDLLSKAPATHHGDLVTLSDGTRFFRIERMNPEGDECVPETQHAVALMLKGIANIADVVSVKSPDKKQVYHFSYALDLDDVGENENPYSLGAQQILLDTLFGDSDHHVVFSNGVPNNDNDVSNVRTSEDQKRFYFFDFNQAFEEAFLTGRTDSRAYVKSRMTWVNQDEESRQEFQRLLHGVKVRFQGKEGLSFVRAVVEKVDVPMRKLFAHHSLMWAEAMLNGGFERHFRNEIVRRVGFMEDYLDKNPVIPPSDEVPYSGDLQ